MVHRLKAMLLVLFDLGQAMRPYPGEGVKSAPRGLCAELVGLAIANIGILASVPRHGINAARTPPFPDRCEIKSLAGIVPNETISLNSGEYSDPVTSWPCGSLESATGFASTCANLNVDRAARHERDPEISSDSGRRHRRL